MLKQIQFRFFQFLIAIDQVFNTLLGTGWADETLSAAAWRVEQKGSRWGRVWRPFIDWLFFWQLDHCRNAHIAEQARAQSPVEQRKPG